MNRRDVVVGLGGIVGAGALASGTGAFSAAEVSRQAKIEVVDDSDGLVGLVANEEISGVRMDSNGELTISIGGDDPGVNVNSVYQFGAFVTDSGVSDLTGGTFSVVTASDPSDLSDGQNSLESAFAIVNQTGDDLSVTVDFELNDDIEGGAEYAFELQSSKDGSGTREGLATSPITGQLTAQLATGESIGVSFIVNALDGVTDDEISGSLSLSATPP
ncbi:MULTISPECIES: hypothetical protein [Halolamina]|uniref:DUF1102 domain-containing protein n=1 Tax=Halolamina pelagica TaxID=699431 RepID=A0A1I5SBC3_9EURY|nr:MULTISPECIES: hypothetical protein [Halolamina]NHX37138.1 hypothetical protein [Halolamina sp. R1-12]SFP68002.1 hypothetical protein SAMN05216277_10637 [Halolamina pelagica]